MSDTRSARRLLNLVRTVGDPRQNGHPTGATKLSVPRLDPIGEPIGYGPPASGGWATRAAAAPAAPAESHDAAAPGAAASPVSRLPVADDPAGDTGDTTPGVHTITKNTDYWFEREVSVIERKAVEMATDWASKGLPRYDVVRTATLAPELHLAMLCAKTFSDWQLRVRTKLQDAVERSSQQLGVHVGTIRSRLARLVTLGLDLSEREEKIEKLRQEMAAAESEPVRYLAFVPNWVFWICAALLAGVEFFANFPVFRLLLPLDAALEQAAASAAQNIDDRSWLAGVELFGRNLVWNVEAGLVALVAVIVLVLLGKQAGKSMRPILALRPADYPLAASTVRSHNRQHLALAGISIVGLAFVLAFLTSSRGQIAATAASRVAQDSVLHDVAVAELADAQARQDRNALSAGMMRVQLREEALQRRKEQKAYAETVQLNNINILWLNLGLVATAIMLGFGNARAELGDRQGEHPDLVRLRDRCNELRREIVAVEAETRAAVALAHASIGNVEHLSRAHPLRGWESKMRRLEGVLPLFRAENAQRRSMDDGEIRAFDAPPVLELPSVDESVTFAEPAEFGRLRRELDDLIHRLEQHAAGSASAEPVARVA